MAAIAYPTTTDWTEPRPRHLHAVPPSRPRARRRMSRAMTLRRRRRVVAVGALLVMALAVVGIVAIVRAVLGALGGGPLTSPESPLPANVRPIAAAEYVVQPGDSLWSIARAAHPAGDVRPYVDKVSASLHGKPLQPGQRIEPP